MFDLFGVRFYEWWSGMSGLWRLVISLTLLAVGGLVYWLSPETWLFWVPMLAAGLILLLFSGMRG